jgi:hypothetical protein
MVGSFFAQVLHLTRGHLGQTLQQGRGQWTSGSSARVVVQHRIIAPFQAGWQANCLQNQGEWLFVDQPGSKGGSVMVRLLSTYRILTLQTSLEEVIRLGEDYLIPQDEEDWPPRHLLAWLERKNPDLLSLPIALVLPDATGDGAVFAVSPEGEPLADTPLFRIERRRSPVSSR